MEQQRLDKLIATETPLSRKEAKALIRAGKVQIGGEPARSGDQKVPYGATVTVDGKPLRNQKHAYLMLNKPAGVLCATRDDTQRTVLDLVPENFYRKGLFPAGRLDKDTEGFVLLTDDGGFAHRILSPDHRVPKIYRAAVSPGPVDAHSIAQAFAAGMLLDGGDRCSPAGFTLLENSDPALVELTIYEGMYHQVKRMFARLSLSVVHLKRIQIGGLKLDESLSPGSCREILHKELEEFF